MLPVIVVVLVSRVKGQGAGLGEWFSNLTVHYQYHFQDLLKHRLLGSTPRFRTNNSDLGPESLHFDKFVNDTNASGLRFIVWEPLACIKSA